ncbi:putative Glucosidase II beta subunit like protein [Trypanosoma vivax]|nr:putative Glucosidase II beta subunit like protein [Trypanosoma vivax]
MRGILQCLLLLPTLASASNSEPFDVPTNSKYTVEFSHMPTPLGTEGKQHYPMRLENGSTYVCVMPDSPPQPTSGVDVPTETNKRGNNEVEDAIFKPHEVVLPQSFEVINSSLHNMCYKLNDGWWTYRLCWGDRMEQYHVPPADNKAEKNKAPKSPPRERTHYLLGIAPPQDTLDLRYGVDLRGHRFIYTVYSDGDACDLTHLPRVTEIRLYCPPEGESTELLMTVREAEMCYYILSLSLRGVCVKELQKPQQKPSIIRCYSEV